jgi:hypothetical protein
MTAPIQILSVSLVILPLNVMPTKYPRFKITHMHICICSLFINAVSNSGCVGYTVGLDELGLPLSSTDQEFLATDPETLGSSSGATRFS